MTSSLRQAAAVAAYFVVIFVLPVILTLRTVVSPAILVATSPDPTPLGYTISLSLFLLPMVALLLWTWRYRQIAMQRRAFAYSLVILIPMGILLDVLFGNSFFVFPNHYAVTGLSFPAVGGPLPLEEIVFYVSGFSTVLLIYVWGDEYWLARYNVTDYATASAQLKKLLYFHWPSVFIGLTLIALAVTYKKTAADSAAGFPWYFTYITLVALVPSLALYPGVKAFINWRALNLTFLVMVQISLIWEATLALPYGWWGFQSEAMMGIFIGAWHGLPLEEVVVWFAVSYTTVIIYEAIKIWLASGRKLRQLLF